MQRHRLYFMHAGQIRSAREIEAETDQAAIAKADQLRGPEPAELWDRARVVQRFQPRPDA